MVVRRGRGLFVGFAALAARQGDAAGNQADAADDGQRRERRLVGAERLSGGDFAGQRVLWRGDNGIAGQSAIRAHADKRALPLPEVVFDDEIGAAVEGDEQVAALLRGGDVLRAEACRKVGELVADAVFRRDVQRAAGGVEVVLGDRAAAAVVQGEGDLGHVAFLFYCLHQSACRGNATGASFSFLLNLPPGDRRAECR